jgi:hypothetical protein
MRPGTGQATSIRLHGQKNTGASGTSGPRQINSDRLKVCKRHRPDVPHDAPRDATGGGKEKPRTEEISAGLVAAAMRFAQAQAG